MSWAQILEFYWWCNHNKLVKITLTPLFVILKYFHHKNHVSEIKAMLPYVSHLPFISIFISGT